MRNKKLRWLKILIWSAMLIFIIGISIYFFFKPKAKIVKIDHRQDKVLIVVDFMKNLQTSEVSTKLDNSLLTTAILDGPVILLDIDHMPNDWQTALRVIWERSRITAKYPTKIDLRFQSPILTYGQE